MITIISATNRALNNTVKVANAYEKMLVERGISCQLLSLEAHTMTERNVAFKKVEADYLIAATKFIIVSPEYNGSYPGVLKMMIDNSDIKNAWAHKKVLLTGVSTGRAGNLRGMEHLTGCLLHMKMNIHHNRLPISLVDTLLDAEGVLADKIALKAIEHQLDEFLKF